VKYWTVTIRASVCSLPGALRVQGALIKALAEMEIQRKDDQVRYMGSAVESVRAKQEAMEVLGG
jgi:hypothetical protein